MTYTISDEDYFDDQDFIIECSLCQSNNFIMLGKLGNKTWLSCRDCGIEKFIKENNNG